MYNLQQIIDQKNITQNTTLMSNQQIFIIYTSEQKDILAAMDTITFSSSSLNMSLNF